MRKNLNKATAIAAIVVIATGLFPAIAQAKVAKVRRLLRFSGISALKVKPDDFLKNVPVDLVDLLGFSVVPVNDSVDLLEFSLRAAEDVNSLDSQGEFPGAIRQLRVDTNDDSLDLFLKSGTLLTSRLTSDPTTGNFPGLSFGYQAITDNNFPYATFNNDGLRYDFTFDNRSETLTLFIPSNDSSLINSLSNLASFLNSIQEVQGVVSYPDVGIEQRFLLTDSLEEVVTVSEPTATASLLGVGVLGAISLHKRNKRLRKPV